MLEVTKRTGINIFWEQPSDMLCDLKLATNEFKYKNSHTKKPNNYAYHSAEILKITKKTQTIKSLYTPPKVVRYLL